jgi:redox-sensitive bicupin YhaK (pirin superfamily)
VPNPPLSRRDVLLGAAAAAAAGAVPASLAGCTNGGRSGSRPAAVLPASPLAPAALTLRRAGERGHANHGWLDTWHTFSFASYHDPRHMGFRSLRVINDDVIAAGEGFPRHPHQDMEIVTYVLDGALEHKDSMGNGGVIRPGEVQQMSAGTGVFHSEYNPSRRERVHLLQVWIEPDVRRVRPKYDQRVYPTADRTGRLRLVASGDGRDGSIPIHSSTNMYASIVEPGRSLAYRNPEGRHVWLHVARGSLDVNGVAMGAGDGAAVSTAGTLELVGGREGGELLLFDLA